MTRTDQRPDLTKDAVLAPSDEAIGALATAMWDAVHTVRLSEHPEETEPMIERAKATARWLGRFGWSVVRSDVIAQAEQVATERERDASLIENRLTDRLAAAQNENRRLTAERDRLAEAARAVRPHLSRYCASVCMMGGMENGPEPAARLLNAALSSLSAPEQPAEAAEDLVLTEAKAWSDATAALAAAKAELAAIRPPTPTFETTDTLDERRKKLAEANDEWLRRVNPHMADAVHFRQMVRDARIERLTAERDRLAEAAGWAAYEAWGCCTTAAQSEAYVRGRIAALAQPKPEKEGRS